MDPPARDRVGAAARPGDPDAAERPYALRVNEPLTVDQARLYLVGHGYAPRLRLVDTAGEVAFDAVPAVTVGGPRDYLDRPGFWHGGVGVAACWLGGVAGLYDVLARTASRHGKPHALAHLGAVDAALANARWMIIGAAAEIDADPGDAEAARIRALRVRTVADRICADVMDHVGRAIGAGPLAHDADVAQRFADIAVYTRQCHAERDEQWLGELRLAEGSAP